MRLFRIAYLVTATVALGSGLMFALDPPASTYASRYEIPEGKNVLVRLSQSLETGSARSGQHFKAALAEDLIAPNGNRIPRGSRVRGHISRVSQGMHPRLLLSFDDVQTQRGWEPFFATVTGLPGEHGMKEDDDGSIEVAPRESKSDSIDEPRSPWSKIGGVAGFFADHSVRLQKGTMLEVRLDHALQVEQR